MYGMTTWSTSFAYEPSGLLCGFARLPPFVMTTTAGCVRPPAIALSRICAARPRLIQASSFSPPPWLSTNRGYGVDRCASYPGGRYTTLLWVCVVPGAELVENGSGTATLVTVPRRNAGRSLLSCHERSAVPYRRSPGT